MPPGRGGPPVHGVHLRPTVNEQHAAMAEAGHVVEEQPDGGRLVHHDVVALVGTAPVDVHVRHRAQRLVGVGAAGVSAAAEGGGEEQPVGAAFGDEVAVGAGRLGVLHRLLHDHDDVAALGRAQQGAALQANPDRVAQHRDDEGERTGAVVAQCPGERVRPVSAGTSLGQDALDRFRAQGMADFPVEHARHGGRVHADGAGDVNQPDHPAPARRLVLSAGCSLGHTASGAFAVSIAVSVDQAK